MSWFFAGGVAPSSLCTALAYRVQYTSSYHVGRTKCNHAICALRSSLPRV